MAQGDGSVLISVDLELREAEKELARLKDKILRLHEDLYVKKVERTNIEESLANAKAALDKQDRDFYRKNRDIIDIKKSYTEAERDILKEWM